MNTSVLIIWSSACARMRLIFTSSPTTSFCIRSVCGSLLWLKSSSPYLISSSRTHANLQDLPLTASFECTGNKKHSERSPKPSRSAFLSASVIYTIIYCLSSIIIDQTSFQDDLSFRIGHITKLQSDLFQRISNHISLDLGTLIFHRFSDLRHEDIVAVTEA